MFYFHTLTKILRPEAIDLLNACLQIKGDIKQHLSPSLWQEIRSSYEFLLTLPEVWREELINGILSARSKA